MRFVSVSRVFPCIIVLRLAFARPPGWMYKSMFAASEKPVLANAIAVDPEGVDALRTLLTYYKDMERNMSRFRTISSDFDEFLGNIPNFLEFFGLPKMNTTQRVYLPLTLMSPEDPLRKRLGLDVRRFRKQRRQFQADEKPVFEAIEALSNAVDSPEAAKDVKRLIARRKGSVLQWQHVFHRNRANYTTKSRTHQCILRSNIAYRINGTWSIGALVTNDRPEAHLGEKERLYLAEYLRLSSSGRIDFQPLLFDLNYEPDITRKYWGRRAFVQNQTAEIARTPISTTVSEFGGQASLDFFIDRPRDQNIALVAALKESRELTRQTLDSSAASNTAILIFPIFMALVPVALFADVTDTVILGYMVVTDFLAVLPLAIKGVELLVSGLSAYFATRTMVYGDLQSANTVVAATYSCRCESGQNLTTYGAAFVSIAIVAMVVGVSLEFVVKGMVERNNREIEENWAAQEEYIWERKPVCSECDCDKHSFAKESPSRSASSSFGGGLIGQLQQRRQEVNEPSMGLSIGIGF